MIAPRCERCRTDTCWKAAAPDDRALGPRQACALCPGHSPCDVADGYLVDLRCKHHLAEQLADLVEYYALAESELIPGSGNGRGTDRPIGLRLTTLDVLAGHDLLGRLGDWESDWRDMFGHAPPAARHQPDLWGVLRTQPVQISLTEIVGYLQTWLDKACRIHPAIADFGREIRDLHHVMRVAARITTVATFRVTCPAFYGETQTDCGHMLKVSPDLDETVDCRHCGTRWTTRRLLLVAAHDSQSEIWLDAAAMSEMTGLSERTLQRWGQSGRIRREGGRYSLASVQAARIGDLA